MTYWPGLPLPVWLPSLICLPRSASSFRYDFESLKLLYFPNKSPQQRGNIKSINSACKNIRRLASARSCTSSRLGTPRESADPDRWPRSLQGTGKVALGGQTGSFSGCAQAPTRDPSFPRDPLPAPARQLTMTVCLSVYVSCTLHPSPFPLLLKASSGKVLLPELGVPVPCASCTIVSGPRWHSRSAAAPPWDKPSRMMSLSCVSCMMCSLQTPWVQQMDRQRREER